jgi:hypothetical protein
MKHLDGIIAGYKMILSAPADILSVSPMDRLVYGSYIKMLTADNTKRLIFDARQAQVFDDIGKFTLDVNPGKIKPPFEHFYMELTEPILLNAQEQGYRDWLRSFIFWSHLDVTTIVESREIKRVEWINKLTLFFEAEDGGWVDRTFTLTQDLTPLVNRLSTGIDRNDAHQLGVVRGVNLPEWVGDKYAPVGFQDPAEPREITWWEGCISSYTSLFKWICSYMMAKSVVVEEIPLSRQIRRAAMREGRLPQPWHVVKVGGEGKEHGHRYDVIGHLRAGRHKKKDGTYVEGIEWVESHQRGLKHELYIPKTYKVEGNRKIDTKSLKQYLNQK